jgi:Ca2+-binding EF-hand superfamily protein
MPRKLAVQRFRSFVGLATLILIGLLPVAGHAQQPKADAFLQQWDADNDGTISLDEIKKAAIARFDLLDRKQKGTLTRNQLAGVLTFQEFRRADTDKNGTIDKDEFLSVVMDRFQAADKDHDGTLDKKELESSAGKFLLRLFSARQGGIL